MLGSRDSLDARVGPFCITGMGRDRRDGMGRFNGVLGSRLFLDVRSGAIFELVGNCGCWGRECGANGVLGSRGVVDVRVWASYVLLGVGGVGGGLSLCGVWIWGEM